MFFERFNQTIFLILILRPRILIHLSIYYKIILKNTKIKSLIFFYTHISVQ